MILLWIHKALTNQKQKWKRWCDFLQRHEKIIIDCNINIYISNEKKHNESLTMSEAGLIKDCLINAVPAKNIAGTF